MNTTNPIPNDRAEIAVSQRFESDLLTREEAAVYLGVAVQTLAIWKCTKRQDLPFVKIGRLCKYRRSELDAFSRRHSFGEGREARLDEAAPMRKP
jgi:excisionase family DNA binding protein